MFTTSHTLNNTELYIGLMSGTSLDGIDGVLCAIDGSGQVETLVHVSERFSDSLKELFLTLQAPSQNELHLEALAANQIAIEYAKVTQRILQLASVTPDQVVAVGAHGQTIRHQPSQDVGKAYSLQSLNGALFAELVQMDIIHNFRARDIAAGGQGAPLVPAFHHAQFGKDKHPKAILNLGGISNLTLLDPQQAVLGFDTGPANLLLDSWIHFQHHLPYDDHGAWAKSGLENSELLEHLLNEPYFSKPIPKSTGRDLFNLNWLQNKIALCKSILQPEDVQATLLKLTAQTIVQDLKRYLPSCKELIVCGGGANNLYLLEKITQTCQSLQLELKVCTTHEYGLDPQTIEAMAFAWLAWGFKHHKPTNLPDVTGAKGPRILGSLHCK
jgi:anhydro-N-acetylmuramic acid kinase